MAKKYRLSITQILVCLIAFTALSKPLSSQVLAPEQTENKWLALAKQQFLDGHYRAAIQSADKYLSLPSTTNAKQYYKKDEATYYKTVAAIKLNDADGIDHAGDYVYGTANPTYKQRTAFALAQYYFNNNQLGEAIEYYEMAGIANLDNREIADAKFELAYAYFNNNQLEQAAPLLAAIKEIDGKYNIAANYYYGLLAYNNGNYDAALESFKKVEKNPEYESMVPYYIAEIHYFKGEKEKAQKEALRLIQKREKTYYHNELHLLVAQIYFEEGNYDAALPYFEHYYNNTDIIRKEDLYEFAYCYYDASKWEQAIDKLKQLSDTKDSLGQTSMYLLGDCYLKTGDKLSARNAYSICADMPYISAQKEASLFLSAKLSYDLGYNAEAIYYINLLLADFSRSRFADEANTMLSDLLIKTSNYAEAYNALQEVATKTSDYARVSQKVTYGYAMQLLQAGQTAEAEALLNKSLKYPVDNTYTTASNFWKAEIAYQNQQYADVLKHATAYLNNQEGRKWVTYLSPSASEQNILLNMGYASMELGKYDEAQTYFNKSKLLTQQQDSAIAIATTLKEADAVFMQKNYPKAIELYNSVIAANSPEKDYALYQKAIILGLQGQNKEKVTLLQGLVETSKMYAYEARYEMALTYIEEDKYSAAIKTLTPLTEAYDRRNLAPKAWMKIGFSYQQVGQLQKAINAYKAIAEQYPTSEERPPALEALKSLYIQTNQPKAYVQLLKDNNMAEEHQNATDSTYYAAAETQFADNNFEAAITSFQKYIAEFPNGIFITKANYYTAESYKKLNKETEALSYYDAVLANNWSNFSENSALQAAVIAFNNKDYTKATQYYSLLRNSALETESLKIAYNGLMQSYYLQGDLNNAALFADTLSSLPGIDENTLTNINLYKAKAFKEQKDYPAALEAYKKITDAKKADVAAEARYNIAELYFLQGQVTEAEEAASETIKKSLGSDYWVVKSYLLLADVLTSQKDYFNAQATLKSIIKNTKIEELKTIAKDKLSEVKKLDKKESKLSE
ncbi:MAG: tetratricopeptide repeat protein [Flavipsychrobacter sp.]